MKVLTVYLRIYADAFRQTLTGIGKNAWTLLLPIGLLEANALASGLVLSLGFVGQLLVWVVTAAAASCYLYFLGEIVAKSRVRFDEFGKSIKAYFWSVANVFFVLWIAQLVLSLVAGRTPQAGVLGQLLVLAAVILLNAAPEVIYLRGTYGGLETVQRSIRFLQENWIEWGIPNLVLLAAYIWFPRGLLYSLGSAGAVLEAAVLGALLHLAMVFRGHLFAALDGTSHRQRMYRWRSSGAT
ncbi:MAG TPA: hypothetical protein VFE93_01375 [Myxococcaceae bacterium]|nr:hypothetical protein [Myxococcaceae bacterium]